MGLAHDLAQRMEVAASKRSLNPPTSQASVSTSRPAPADPFLLTPQTRGRISNDRQTWPAAFANAQGDTFLTAAKFHGLDESGLAKFSAPREPIRTVDIGLRDLPPAQRAAIAADLEQRSSRAPLMLQNKFSGGQFVTDLHEVVSGNPNAIKVRPVPGFEHKSQKIAFMNQKTWEKAMEGLEKDVASLPMQKVQKIQVGERAGDWLDKSVNSSITQALDGLKAKGYPYEMGAKGDLDGAMDCSGFAGAVFRRVAKNVNESTGQRVFDRVPAGSAADMVTSAMRSGGAVDVKDLLRNPRPGCLIGLDTGEKSWDKGRPNGIDHVALTFRDKSGKMMVAEFTKRPNPSGLHVTDMEKYVQSYSARGAKVFVASPEGLCNKQVLATLNAKTMAEAAPAQAQEAQAMAM